MLGAPIQSWDITSPDPVTGDDAETQYSGEVAIPDPKPNGAGLFAVPAMMLELDASGDLVGSVQFLDAVDDVISEVTLQRLTAAGASTPYAIGATGNTTSPDGTIDQTGTFYSTWSALGTPIPAGSSYLFGMQAYMWAGGINPEGVLPPYTHHVTYTLYLDLGDAAENVLTSIEIATHTWQYTTFDDVSQSVTTAFKSGQGLSIASPAAKKRAKMVVTSNHYCSPYARLDAGGYAEVV